MAPYRFVVYDVDRLLGRAFNLRDREWKRHTIVQRNKNAEAGLVILPLRETVFFALRHAEAVGRATSS